MDHEDPSPRKKAVLNYNRKQVHQTKNNLVSSVSQWPPDHSRTPVLTSPDERL